MSTRPMQYRIILQSQSTTQDDFGQPSISWTNVMPGDGKIWGDVQDITGRQFLAADSTKNRVQTKITIWWRTGITPGMRAVVGNDIYDIEAVLNQDKKTLVLMCARFV